MRKLNFQVSYPRKVPNPSAIQRLFFFPFPEILWLLLCPTRMSHLKLVIYFFSKEQNDKENCFHFNGWNCFDTEGEEFRVQFCDLENNLANSGWPLGFTASVAEFWALEICSARSSRWCGRSNNSTEKSGMLYSWILLQAAWDLYVQSLFCCSIVS